MGWLFWWVSVLPVHDADTYAPIVKLGIIFPKFSGEHLKKHETTTENLAILRVCDLFGMLIWPFQRFSHLQPEDKKVTLNHLVVDIF